MGDTRRRKRRRAVSREGLDGYQPDVSRISVWALDGELAAELAKRGTLGHRHLPVRGYADNTTHFDAS